VKIAATVVSVAQLK